MAEGVTLLDGLSGALLLAGGALCLIGGIGILRLPDFYSRTHAVSLGDSLGAVLILLGLAVEAGAALVTAKLLTIVIFLLITGPAAAHALCKAAYSRGLTVESEVLEEESVGDSA